MSSSHRVPFLAALVAVALQPALASATPAPTSMSPAVATPGQTVTVAGTDLAPSGFLISVVYSKKYLAPGESSTGTVVPASTTATTLTFAAPANAVPGSFRVRYLEEPTKALQLAARVAPAFYSIPGTLFVKEPPTIAAVNGAFTIFADMTTGWQLAPGAGRSFVVTGRNLVPVPGTAVNFTIGTLNCSSGATARYDTTKNGHDELTITVPEPVASFIGTATATTSVGSATAPRWIVSRRARLTAVEEINASGGVVGPSNGRLVRGRRYQIRGTDFAFPAAAPFELHSRLHPSPVATVSDSTASDTRVVFVLPSTFTASSVTLTLSAPGGDLAVGTFPVGDPGALPPPLAGLVISPSPTVQGSVLNAVVSFAGSITPGVDVGGILISSSDDAHMVGLPKVVPITANPMTIALPTFARGRLDTRAITARLTRLTGINDQVSTTVQLTPPAFTGLSVLPASMPGGGVATLRATFDFPAGAPVDCGNLLFSPPDLLLSISSAPTALVSVMNPNFTSTRGICVTAPAFDLDVLTQAVTTATDVVITATQGGTTRTATITLTPPTFDSIKLSKSALTSMQGATGTLALSSPIAGAFALVSSSDPSVSVPGKAAFATGAATLTFPVTTQPVPSARSVTLSAVVNNVTKSTTVQLSPLEIQSLALSASSVRAGSNVAATVQLNATIDMPFTATLTSSDPAIATVPASVQFAVGQNAAVISVQSVAPQSGNRDVTITATYSVTLPGGGTVTTTKNAVLTVTP